MLKAACFGFGGFKKFTEKLFLAVFKVIGKLGLQWLFAVGIFWLILAVALPGGRPVWLKVVVIVLAALALMYAAVATAFNISAYRTNPAEHKKNKRNKSNIVISVDELPKDIRPSAAPVYYRVRQNPDYLMAEYPDRIELYYTGDGEMTLVKITPKDARSE